jgi:hypothetical protein
MSRMAELAFPPSAAIPFPFVLLGSTSLSDDTTERVASSLSPLRPRHLLVRTSNTRAASLLSIAISHFLGLLSISLGNIELQPSPATSWQSIQSLTLAFRVLLSPASAELSLATSQGLVS